MKRNKLDLAMVVAIFAIVIAGSFLMSRAAESIEVNETKDVHHVVIEATSGEPKDWEKLMSNTENLINAFGAATIEIEIVCHGDGLKLLMKSSAASPITRMQKLVEDGVVFAACENTMERMKLTAGDLMEFAILVSSGVAEIVLKQEREWAYLKR